MAYGVLYRTLYKDLLGISKQVDIEEDGFVGDVTVITSTRNPVHFAWDPDADTKYPQIIASSIDLFLRSPSRQYFLNLFTSNKFKYKVKYYVASALVWQGYLLPDLYSEVYDKKDFVVSLKAADGIGMLKNIMFVDGSGDPYTGQKTDFEIITICLDKLGLGLNIFTAVDLYETRMDQDPGDDPLKQSYTDTAILEGMNCADVLREILKPYGAVLYQGKSCTNLNDYGWHIVRFAALGTSYEQRKYQSDGTLLSYKQIEGELITGWTNNDFDTFAATGKDITSAIDAGGSGNHYGYSNQIAFAAGDLVRFDYDLTRVSGAIPHFTLFNETAPNNEIDISLSDGAHKVNITVPTAGTYRFFIYALNVAENFALDASLKYTNEVYLTNESAPASTRNIMIMGSTNLKMIPGARRIMINQDYGLKDNILTGGDNDEEDFTYIAGNMRSNYWTRYNGSTNYIYGKPVDNNKYALSIPGKVNLYDQDLSTFAVYAQRGFPVIASSDKIQFSFEIALRMMTPDDDPFTESLDTYIQVILGSYVLTKTGWRVSSSVSWDKRYLKHVLAGSETYQTVVYSGLTIPETGTIYIRLFQAIDNDIIPASFTVEFRVKSVNIKFFIGDTSFDKDIEFETIIDENNNYEPEEVDILAADLPDVPNARYLYTNGKFLSDGSPTKNWQKIGGTVIEPLIVALARAISDQYLIPTISYEALIRDVHANFGNVIVDPWDDIKFRMLAITNHNDADCEMQARICQILTESTPDPYLLTDLLELDIPNEAGSVLLIIHSNLEWDIVSSETWLTVSDATAIGDKVITVYYEASTTARTATLTISATGVSDVVVDVSQEGKSLVADPDNLEFPLAGGELEFVITSNTPWEITASPAWITCVPTSGSGNETVVVTCDPNAEDRYDDIYITPEGLSDVLVHVIQEDV